MMMKIGYVCGCAVVTVYSWEHGRYFWVAIRAYIYLLVLKGRKNIEEKEREEKRTLFLLHVVKGTGEGRREESFGRVARSVREQK